ncbi:DUF4238 domain-containing protein [Shewanella halifaxensis]|uniref:DUF4238 domain-containing protein n=1 Tax=Shewanella halifaxensis TaxID=271098 RepID=UPI000D59C8FD|nr:DUF4238 domain-containing protein [Shewanella halifaxensis]
MDPVTQHTPKKQHYVPQFLLRNFSVENTEKLFTFNKQQDKVFPTTVRDSASENGFYNIEVSENKYTLEHKLVNLETLASQVISKICLAESLADLEEDDHQILCFFAANLLLRVKRQRIFTSQLNAGMANFARKLGLDPNSFSNFSELTKEEVDFQHVNFVNKELFKFANRFGDKAVGLLRSPDNCSFIISDNPVVMYCYKPDKFKSKGVSVPGIEIFLPISKKLCISFLCVDFFHELAEKVTIIEDNKANNPELSLIDISYAKPLIESIKTGEASNVNENHVEFVNSLQIIDSWSYIYNDSDDFSLAKKIINNNPAISSANIVKFGI